ncbi:MAG: anti-sigma F factor [Oscillospiraceae bacterium]|jgi:stage II sporulation protein AB (anti-sigma F factor)
MRPKPDNHMSLTFPSLSSNEAFARTAVACFLAQQNPTLEELDDVKTAVSEAVTNCIVHAYPDTIGTIHLIVRMFEDVVELTVKDHGAGIPDISQAMAPLFTTGGEDRSGMGFTIMESFMDALRVRSAPGRGTTLVMRKTLHTPLEDVQ